MFATEIDAIGYYVLGMWLEVYGSYEMGILKEDKST